MPLIESYAFGRISIDGHKYSSDVLIYPERVEAGWWRQEGHNLQLADLQSILECSPDVLVIGTGTFGRMAVSPKLRDQLEGRGIELVIARTPKAVKEYNQIRAKGTVAAALHLTC